MTFIKENAGWIALVILAIMGVVTYFGGSQLFGTTCDQITCIDGGLRITNGPLESTGNIVDSGNLSVTGTLGVTATTTLSDTVNFNNPAICINFYATSTATRVHFTASTTPTLPAGAAGVMTFDYGACTN